MVSVESQEYLAYCKQLETEIEEELRLNDPITRRFRFISFVSKSKGKHRKRKLWMEVELVYDRYMDTYTSYHRYKFDAIASEVLPSVDRVEVTKVLMERVRYATT